jgi:hypothetical protein
MNKVIHKDINLSISISTHKDIINLTLNFNRFTRASLTKDGSKDSLTYYQLNHFSQFGN